MSELVNVIGVPGEGTWALSETKGNDPSPAALGSWELKLECAPKTPADSTAISEWLAAHMERGGPVALKVLTSGKGFEGRWYILDVTPLDGPWLEMRITSTGEVRRPLAA